MSHLNKDASISMNEIGVNACTDITGFGLLGHLFEMCKASNVSSTISFNQLPLIQGVYELAQQNFIPGGTKKNLDFIESNISFSNNISKEEKYIMADSQTSGGLLISTPKNKVEQLQKILNENGCISNNIVGEINESNDFSIYVK